MSRYIKKLEMLISFSIITFILAIISACGQNNESQRDIQYTNENLNSSSSNEDSSYKHGNQKQYTADEIEALDTKLYDKLYSEEDLSFPNILPSYHSDTGLWDYMEKNRLQFSRLEYKCEDNAVCTITGFVTKKSKPKNGKDTQCGKMGVWESGIGNIDKWTAKQGIAVTIKSYDTDAVMMVIDEENKRWKGCS